MYAAPTFIVTSSKFYKIHLVGIIDFNLFNRVITYLDFVFFHLEINCVKKKFDASKMVTGKSRQMNYDQS